MNFLTTPKEKTLYNWTLLDTNLLICSLFTLVPNDKLFKELNITKYYYSTETGKKLVLVDLGYLNNFFLLLNKPLIRQLVYNIVQPLLKEVTYSKACSANIKNNSFDHKALKNYLKKFKYYYKLFFLENSFFIKSQMTEKEINFLAIKLLFILIGI